MALGFRMAANYRPPISTAKAPPMCNMLRHNSLRWRRRPDLGHIVAVMLVFSPACGERSPADPPLRVLVAASLMDVVTELGAAFHESGGPSLRVTSGASGILCEQIRSGAPCDVFIPADPAFIDRVQREGEAWRRETLAGNRLVLIAPLDASEARDAVHPVSSEEITSVIQAWRRIVIANPAHAPAGAKARDALVTLHLWSTVQDRTVFADDVRMAARYVAEGAVDGGIVYQTDALAFADRVRPVGTLPGSICEPVRYDGATRSVARNMDAAVRFLRFMQSEAGRVIWRRHGFETHGVSP